jgi:hypothetical protein
VTGSAQHGAGNPARPASWLLPLVWLAAVVSLCWLYFPGLQAWFCADDFAWLGLLRQTTSFHSLLNALFRPEAQGTMRFLSERGFFILFERLFGLDNLPWRIAVFATAAGDIALIMWLTRRISGSALAAAIAPFLWLVNRSLATVMAWDSSYNEVLCPLFLMAALALFIRYVETGRSVFWWCQLVVFVLGFGVLEVNTVYPALAAAWILTAAPVSASKRRGFLLSLLPLAAISAGYFLLHTAYAPFVKQGPYAFQIDRRIFSTFALYWKWALVPESWDGVRRYRILGTAILALETLALLGSSLRDLRAGRRQPLFFLSWYVLTIAPLLPLPNHRTDYYLTIPIIGLSMLAASSVARLIEERRPEARGVWRLAAPTALVAIYLLAMIPAAHAGVVWWYERSYPLRALVLGVDAAQKTHPGKIIVMDGITDALWDDGFAQGAFYPLHIDHVYLTPESADKIHPAYGPERLSELVLDPSAMHNAITHSQVVVYSVVNDHLRNITDVYARSEAAKTAEQLQVGEPRRVDVGSPLFSYLLGPEWFPPEAGFRWMPSHASLRMGGPKSAGDVLALDGYFPDLQRKGVFAHLSVAIDRIPVGYADMNDPDGRFHRLFKVPASLVGKDQVEVEFTVDPVLHGLDGHNRGLVFGSVSFERSIFNPN